MDLLDQAIILVAGIGAGTINAMVGSGTLITFPVLVLLGVPPLEANVSNNIGLVPGSVSSVFGYRRELVGQGARLKTLSLASLLGGLVGAVALLVLPSQAFAMIVPVLIVVALVAVIAQPALARRVASRQDAIPSGPTPPGEEVMAATVNRVDSGSGHSAPLWLGVLATGVYGGYFGAAKGVLLLALLGIFISDHLQRLNAAKNVLAMVANGVAAMVFIMVAQVNWRVVVLIAIGSTVGGQLGAGIGRRLATPVLRGIVVIVGLVAVWHLLLAP